MYMVIPFKKKKEVSQKKREESDGLVDCLFDGYILSSYKKAEHLWV